MMQIVSKLLTIDSKLVDDWSRQKSLTKLSKTEKWYIWTGNVNISALHGGKCVAESSKQKQHN